MKFLIILSFICIVFGVETQHKRRYGPEQRCSNELHLNREKMKAMINEDNTDEENLKAGEFLVCVFKRRGVADDNGTINENGLRKFLELIFYDTSIITEEQKATVQHVLNNCKNIHRDTHAKTAVKLKNCITKYVMEYDS